MENLPQDMIFDILSRIPVKSVGRFRCVCKSWRSLISKPEFVKTHLNRAMTDDVSVGCQRVLIPYNMRHSGNSLESIDYEALHQLSNKKLKAARQNKGARGNACTVLDFPYSGPECYVELVGYCHGVVGMKVDFDKIIICNPCTREFRELPKPTSINFQYAIHGGLGYDSSVDDYKFVIVVVDYTDGEKIKAEIFSLRSNSWRILHDIPPDILRIYGFEPGGVFLNGALHWIAICKTGQQIISFDLATEKIRDRLPLPPVQGNREISYYDYSKLILLGGCLSVSDSRSSRNTKVWIMKEYGVEASWTKLFTLLGGMKPLWFSKNGELLVNVHDEIRIYNPKKKYSRKLYIGSYWLNEVIVFIESLVSPYGNGENNDHNIKQ